MRASRRTLALGAPLLALGLSLSSCGSEVGASDELLGQGSQPPTSAATTTLITLMVDAQFNTLFQGERRYEIHSSATNAPPVLIYRERVSSDGLGEFAIEPLDLIEPVLSPPDEAQFLLLQALREGLFFRYRDVFTRDADLLLANYVVVDTGLSVQVVGRDCAELELQRAVSPDRKYVLHVDLVTGMVLRAREMQMDNTLISLSEYETLDLAPDLSNVVFHVPMNSELELDPDSSQVVSNLGFLPRPPKMVPNGWSLLSFSKVVDPSDGSVWAKYAYTDGLELMFLVQAELDLTHQLKGAPPGPPYGAETVTSMTIGGMCVLKGHIQQRDMVAVGKVGRQVLADLIQSTF